MTEKHMGNPNPSPETRFGAGNRANPQGKTSEQKKQELRNAEMAAKIRGQMLEAMLEAYEDQEGEQLVERMDAQALKMLKDAEDRGFGAPVQDVRSSDGSMSPKPNIVELVGKTNDEGAD